MTLPITPPFYPFFMHTGEGAFATVEKCLYTPRTHDGSIGSGKSGLDSLSGEEQGPTSPTRRVTREVAVKKLKPEIVSNDSDLDSFMAEVRATRAPSGQG